MRFFPLGPTAYLTPLLGAEYPFHMVLAQHLYTKDFTPTDYFMYFRRRAALNGYTVILDNGVYEGKWVTQDYLLRATMELSPQVVVLPDVIGNMAATIEGGEVFKALLKRHGWKGRTMTVLQAEANNTDQYIHAYMEACKQSMWIGFPRNGLYGVDGGRAGFILRLQGGKQFDVRHTHHALGMKDGSLSELAALNETALFDSIDSSAPIWRGLNDVSLLDPLPEHKWWEEAFDPNWFKFNLSGVRAVDNLHEVEIRCR